MSSFPHRSACFRASAVLLLIVGLTGCGEWPEAAGRVTDVAPIAGIRDRAASAVAEIRDQIPNNLPSRISNRVRDELNSLPDIPSPGGITDLSIVQEAPPAGQVAVNKLTWTDRGEDGGKSLLVAPSKWAQEAGFSGWEATWREIIAAEPSADTNSMRNQLICHTIGAVNHEVWHLEPWRPDVGLTSVLAARCNPS